MAFVRHYLATFNASEAARQAGYSDRTAYSIGWENLRKPEIREEIDRQLAAASMPASEVLARLTTHARFDIGELFDTNPETGALQLSLAKAKERGVTHLIKKYSDGKSGVSVEVYDAQSALALLGKHHGLFVERVDISQQEIEAFLDRLKQSLSEEEYARIVAIAAGEDQT